MNELQTPRHSVPRPDPDLNASGPTTARGFCWSELLLGFVIGCIFMQWLVNNGR